MESDSVLFNESVHHQHHQHHHSSDPVHRCDSIIGDDCASELDSDKTIVCDQDDHSDSGSRDESELTPTSESEFSQHLHPCIYIPRSLDPIDLELPASEIDQISSSLTESFFKRNLTSNEIRFIEVERLSESVAPQLDTPPNTRKRERKSPSSRQSRSKRSKRDLFNFNKKRKRRSVPPASCDTHCDSVSDHEKDTLRKSEIVTLTSDDESSTSSKNRKNDLVENKHSVEMNDGSIRKSARIARRRAEQIAKSSEAREGPISRTRRKLVPRVSQVEDKSKSVISSLSSELTDGYDANLEIDGETFEPRVTIDPVLFNHMKGHQVDGVKFMYKMTIGGIDKLLKGDRGSSCILAHCMGLGKSLMIISFIHTLLTDQYIRDHIKSILLIVPVTTIINWRNELEKWASPDQLKELKVHFLDNECDSMIRFSRLERWRERGGLAIIEQGLFERLANNSNPERRVNLITKCFVNPGPDLIIMDEITQKKHPDKPPKFVETFARIKTQRKIIFTGLPLKSALDEYYLMAYSIRPEVLGKWTEFKQRFRDPIRQGLSVNSCSKDFAFMVQKLNELESLLSSFTQRYGPETFSLYIPSKTQFALFIRPSKLIADVYNHCLTSPYPKSKLFSSLSLCVNHPVLIRETKPAIQDLMLKHQAKVTKNEHLDVLGPHSQLYDCIELEHSIGDDEIKIDDSNEFSPTKDLHNQFNDLDDWEDYSSSGKFVMLFKIIKSCEDVGDKLLVISRSLETLDLIESHLQIHLNWYPNVHYFRVDGLIKPKERLDSIDHFNDPNNKKARVVLASPKACAFGINLQIARRCIIFDVLRSPRDDFQAISRLYRLGQTNSIYVYHFITKDTIEESIFQNQSIQLGLVPCISDVSRVARPSKISESSRYYDVRPQYEYSHPQVSGPKDDLLKDLLRAGNKEVLGCIEFDSYAEIIKMDAQNSMITVEPEKDEALPMMETNSLEEIVESPQQSLPIPTSSLDDPIPPPSEVKDLESGLSTVQVHQPPLTPQTQLKAKETPDSDADAASSDEATINGVNVQPQCDGPEADSLFPSPPLTPALQPTPIQSSTPSSIGLEDHSDERQSTHKFQLESNSSHNQLSIQVSPLYSCPAPMSRLNGPDIDDQRHVSKNWLNVSNIQPKLELIVEARNRFHRKLIDHSLRRRFLSLYDRFGRHWDEFRIDDRNDQFALLTDDQQTRLKIKQELERIFAKNQSDDRLIVKIPALKRPVIEFEFDHPIKFKDNDLWMDIIKRWNKWPLNAVVLWIDSVQICYNKHKITVEVDSIVRDLIEEQGGAMSIGHRRVNVIDKIGLKFCYNCLDYECDKIPICDEPARCYFCCRAHKSETCPIQNCPSQWFCGACEVKGHSTVSKMCPILPLKIQSRLARYDHKYKNVFFQEFDLRNGESRNAMARLF